MAHISRRAYAEMFGPTVGDRLRLADTELLIEPEIRALPGLARPAHHRPAPRPPTHASVAAWL